MIGSRRIGWNWRNFRRNWKDSSASNLATVVKNRHQNVALLELIATSGGRFPVYNAWSIVKYGIAARRLLRARLRDFERPTAKLI